MSFIYEIEPYSTINSQSWSYTFPRIEIIDDEGQEMPDTLLLRLPGESFYHFIEVKSLDLSLNSIK